MKKNCIRIATIFAFAASMTSCVSMNKSMREPYSRVDFTKNDFTFSDQLTGKGKCTKILGIDFYRWPNSSKMGTVVGDGGTKLGLGSIPVVGNYLSNKSASYALYDIVGKNPGYDVIFYPQYETRVYRPILGIGFIYKRTTVTAMAKLAKLKP